MTPLKKRPNVSNMQFHSQGDRLPMRGGSAALRRKIATTGLAAALVGLGATRTDAATWGGTTSGGQQWNIATNWDTDPVVPNGAGVTASFSISGTLTLYADLANATTITYGTLNLNSNQSLNFGTTGNADATVDAGRFVIDGTGQAGNVAVFNLNGTGTVPVQNGRGIFLSGNKLDYTTLATDLVVNMNLGTPKLQVLGLQGRVATGTGQAVIDGGGHTITINGGVMNLGGSGFNSNPIRNATLDLRNGATSADGNVLSFSGSPNLNNSDVTIKIGAAAGQSINGTRADIFTYRIQNKVNVVASKPFNGLIVDGDVAGSLTFTSSGNTTPSIGGSAGANTFSGGTTLLLNWTAPTGGNTSRLILSKDNALGTGALTFGNNTSLLSLNTANNTVGGLRDGSGGENGRPTGAVISEDATSTANPALRTLDLKNTGTSSFSGSVGTSDLALGADPDMTVARQNNFALVKSGTGTQTLGGNNYYTGSTGITGGTLIVNGTHTGGGTYTVGDGVGTDILGGSGTLALATNAGVNVASGGQISPGNSAGNLKLTLDGTAKLDFAANSSLAFDLGADSDLISFTTLGDWLSGSGNPTLALTLGTGFSYANAYTIFSNVSTIGFGLAGITGYDAGSYNASFGKVGNDYVLSFTAIPEPVSLALLGVGGLLMLPKRRR